mgnify:CR=1 FL=1
MPITTRTTGDIVADIVELVVNTGVDPGTRAEIVVKAVRDILAMGQRLATLDAVTAERDALRAEAVGLRAAAAPSQEDDGKNVDGNPWIPLDGTRFPDVEPGAHIFVWTRNEQRKDEARKATVFDYEYSGGGNDIIAWRRA